MFKVICLLAILSVVYCASVPLAEKNFEEPSPGSEQSVPVGNDGGNEDLEKSEFGWGWGRRFGGWGGWGGYRSYGWGYPRYYGGWGYPSYYRSYYW